MERSPLTVGSDKYAEHGLVRLCTARVTLLTLWRSLGVDLSPRWMSQGWSCIGPERVSSWASWGLSLMPSRRFTGSAGPNWLPLVSLVNLAAIVTGCGEENRQEQELPLGVGEEVLDFSDFGFIEGVPETAVMDVIEFSDFGCIYCARFHEATYPSLYENFVVSGDVLWRYVPLTIGRFPNGDLAGIAAECAGRFGEFPSMRDRIYTNRDEWIDSNRGVDLFVEYAEAEGLDGTKFQACMEGDEARARIEKNNRTAQELGVRATPTFVVQGQAVQGAPPLDFFSERLRESVNTFREAESKRN